MACFLAHRIREAVASGDLTAFGSGKVDEGIAVKCTSANGYFKRCGKNATLIQCFSEPSMGRAINYNMTAFCGVVALHNLWSLPASAETPLHHAELTFADVAPLGPPLFNARISNNLAKLEKICASGDGVACFMLGKAMFKHRRAIEAGIIKYYKAACDAGYADGCFEQGQMVMKGDGAPDAKAAVLLFSKGCDGGSVIACYAKADLLNNGELLPQDCEAAQAAEERVVELLLKQGVEFATPTRSC